MVNWYQNESAMSPLPGGRVLVTGGEHDDCDPGGDYCQPVSVNTAEIFAP
jgi:hypothetical protein